MGGRAPPLRPYTGCTALCPFRDRERPVGQRSSVPKIDKTRRLDRENQNWNHRQKLSDAQKSHKRVHTAAKLIAWHKIQVFLFCSVFLNQDPGHHQCQHMATDKVKVRHLLADVITASCLSFSFNANKISSIVVLGGSCIVAFFLLAFLYQRATANLLGSGGGEMSCSLSLSVTLNLPFRGTLENKLCRLLGQTTGGNFTFATHFCCNANCSSLIIRHMQTTWSLDFLGAG